MCDKAGENAWPEEWYSEDQLAGISLHQFGDFLVPVPGGAEEYLDRTYGTDWRHTGSTHFFCHASAGLLQSPSFQLPAGPLPPALPLH